MKPLVWIAALAVALVVAAYGWNPQREEVRAQGGGAQTDFLPLVMRMPTLTPTVTPTATPTPEITGTTTRVSVASDGSQSNGRSARTAISADSRYVAFESDANNLVPGGTNGLGNVYVYDRVTGSTSLVSLTQDGWQANGASYNPTISADGRFVAYSSNATNLVPGDTNGRPDVFLHDRTTGEVRRISVASDGSQSDEPTYEPDISDDGRYISFVSFATNLVPNDTNGTCDIFVHDQQTASTRRVSVASDGSQAGLGACQHSISGNGRYVTFDSSSNNLVQNDNNHHPDVFLHDLFTGQTTLISVRSDGVQANEWSSWPSISADGRYVAFQSKATNLVPYTTSVEQQHIYVRDGLTEQISITSVSLGGIAEVAWSYKPHISDDGRFVAFASMGRNLVSNDTNEASDVFVRDRLLARTTRVSVASDGTQGNAPSGASYPGAHERARLSADGRFVVFMSEASNLVPGDTNGFLDVFLHERTPSAP